jgi:predicted HicB family RNase H-like nuclease
MMEYRGFIGKAEFDAEAMTLHGELVGIRDVVTFQGRSVEELENAFRDSVDDYLAFCTERGEEPDKPHSGHFVVRIGSDLHRKASAVARSEGKSLNAFVAEAVERDVQQKWPAPTRRKTPRQPRRKREKD